MEFMFGFGSLFFMVPVLSFIIFVAVVIGIIVAIVKGVKHHSDTEDIFTTEKSEVVSKKVCGYCGTVVEGDKSKCPSCVAKLFKK